MLASEQVQADELLAMINSYRASQSLDELTYDEGLAVSMVGHLIHEELHPFSDMYAPEPTVADPQDRAEACGTTLNSAIISHGPSSAGDVFDQWVQDSGIDGILLNANRTRGAVGHYGDSWGLQLGN